MGLFSSADQIQENEVSKIIGSDKVLLRVFKSLIFFMGSNELNTYEENEKDETHKPLFLYKEGQEKGQKAERKGLQKEKSLGKQKLLNRQTMKQNVMQ